MDRSARHITIVLTLMGSLGCGPLVSTHHILQAQSVIEEAETARAEQYAVYEITLAREFLHQAREEQAYSDYEVATHFADEAHHYAAEAAVHAHEKASSAPSGPPPAEPTNAVPSAPSSAPTAAPAAPPAPPRK